MVYPKLTCLTPYLFYMLIALTFFFSNISPWESFIHTLHHYDRTTLIKHKRISVSVERKRQELGSEETVSLFISEWIF